MCLINVMKKKLKEIEKMLKLIIDYSATKLIAYALEMYEKDDTPVALGVEKVCLDTGLPPETFTEEIIWEILYKIKVYNFVKEITYDFKTKLFYITFDFKKGGAI